MEKELHELNQQVSRVGISGSYGGLNLGDEAILEVIVTELRRSLPVEITVFSRDPEDTLARHRVERAVPVRALSRDEVLPEIERLDLLILGGGPGRGLSLAPSAPSSGGTQSKASESRKGPADCAVVNTTATRYDTLPG